MLDVDSDSFLLACRRIGQPQGISLGDGSLEGIISSSDSRIRPIELEPAWWMYPSGPFVGILPKEGKAVAVLPSLWGGYVMIVDQSCIRVTSTVARPLDSRAYVLYPCLVDSPLSLPNLLVWGWQCTKQDVFFATICTLGSQISALALPFLIWEMLDSRVVRNPTTIIPTLIIIICSGTFLLLQLAIKTALYRVETLLNVLYQAAISDRILRLSGEVFFTTGEPVEVMEAMLGLARDVSIPMVDMALKSIAVVSAWSVLTLINSTLGGVIAVMMLILGIGTALFATISRAMTDQYVTAYQYASRLTDQIVQGISKVRIFGLQDRVFQTWLPLFRQVQTLRANSTRFTAMTQGFFTAILIGALIFILVVQVASNGYAIACIILCYQVLIATAAFCQTALVISRTLPVYQKRLMPILQAVPDSKTNRKTDHQILGGLTVSNLSFNYASNGVLALDHVSLQVEPGEFVALIGPSGGGKSTLFKLLLGFEQSQLGTIFYDTHDIHDCDLSSLRKQIGVVLQNSSIQRGDIRTNIAGFAKLPIEHIWEAVQTAALEPFIASLPMKLHTLLDEGGSVLSKGQRQRLLIARAVITRPHIVFFDQATSGLDEQTEAEILHNLENTTRLIIAQRVSTIINADRIYVMDQGRIIQQGTYSELVNSPGYFAEWATQQIR